MSSENDDDDDDDDDHRPTTAFVLASRLLSRCPSSLRSPRLWSAQYTVTGPEFFIIAMGKIPGNRLIFQVGHVT